VDEVGHATDLIANAALAWIRERTGPWFCYVPFTAVHTPIRAPEEWIDRYSDRVYDEDPARDRSFKVFAAYASQMDYAVGRFVETLKALDQIDNTFVVFASDNGAPGGNPAADTALYPGAHEDTPRLGTNAPLRGHKGQLYEGGIRTPAAVHWPSGLACGKAEAPIGMVDWMPTFAALAGCPPPGHAGWDGINALPLLRREQSTRDSPLFWNLRHERFAVQAGEWKLVVTNEDGGRSAELFNLEEDALEQNDLASRCPGNVDELQGLIVDNRKHDDVSKRPDVE
jgi:arylsulfatase A-like enzyme